MSLVFLTMLVGLIGLGFAIYLAITVLRKDVGTTKMKEISEAVQEGAMAFLHREYQAIAIFVLIAAMVLALGIDRRSAIAFVFGAICSVSAGYFGMKIATRANCRTAQAATKGFNEALAVAFPGGAVMGMSVVGIGLFGISLMYIIFSKLSDMFAATYILAGFSMGASSVALFARVGGGVYTKAADVGADLVGKVEAGIPEDDPRNPATIADNVGDNVGDVAGMGADLFESYVGAIVSGLVIASETLPPEMKAKGIFLSLLLAAVGIISSIVGAFFVRTGKRGNPQGALRNGTIASALLFFLAAFLLIKFWYGDINVFFAAFAGLVAGLVTGFVAEYYTSGKPVKLIAESAQTGAGTNLIQGFALGMKSTAIPLVVIGLATMVAYHYGGFFGIAISAIGMLAITGMTVAVDAYGPIADNAGGIVEMAKMDKEVRKVTDSLDAAGNTTAAIAKGLAIGSAALTALALFSAYIHAVRLEKIDIMNAKVIAGLFIGGIIPFIFASATMQAVGRAAFKVVEEVRRQFREIKGLMEGKARAEYAHCVDITTATALKEMVAPGIMAVIIPIGIGFIFGVEMLGGLLAGALVTGVPLAILLANAGGAWDNAKKYIEGGELGGKGSATHKAAVIGDTVGDPFKDTAAPAMNILVKLMTVVSLVFAPLILKVHPYFAGLYHYFIR